MDQQSDVQAPNPKLGLRQRLRSIRVRAWALFIGVMHLAGVGLSVDAVMTVRTPQGAVAWAVSLNTFPYVAVPAYLVFGRSKFQGYVEARRRGDNSLDHLAEALGVESMPFILSADVDTSDLNALEALTRMPFTSGNQVELLIDGEATFAAIEDAIDAAREYILIQFYIYRDDDLGNRIAESLKARAREGVRVLFLFDDFGSMGLSEDWLADLRAAGVDARGFQTTQGWRNRFQLNFRNHRKIVVVDGEVALVGGHNVGVEYLGDPEPWRDTHVRLEGPAVLGVQLAFCEDWNWAAKEVPQLTWEQEGARAGDMEVIVLPSGPADELDTAELGFLHAINSAQERVWIATPYFVPDHSVVSALHLARLRGVDVRILIPESGAGLAGYSAWSFHEELSRSGVRFFRWGPGFMHQKVILVDETAAVGTANFDNRSFRLNFEIMIAVVDPVFSAQVTAMLEEDFAHSKEISQAEVDEQGYLFRLAVQVSRLLSPIQ